MSREHITRQSSCVLPSFHWALEVTGVLMLLTIIHWHILLQFTLFLLRFRFVKRPVWHCVPRLKVYFFGRWRAKTQTQRPIQHCYSIFFVHGGITQCCYLKGIWHFWCYTSMSFFFFFCFTFRPKQLKFFRSVFCYVCIPVEFRVVFVLFKPPCVLKAWPKPSCCERQKRRS